MIRFTDPETWYDTDEMPVRLIDEDEAYETALALAMEDEE